MRLRAELNTPDLEKLESTLLNDAGNSIGVATSTASVSGRLYGLGLLDVRPPEKGTLYLSSNGQPVAVEVISIPYSTLVEA